MKFSGAILTCIHATFATLRDNTQEANEALANTAKAIDQARVEFEITGPTRPDELDVHRCHDVTPDDDDECYKHVMWAKHVGLYKNPGWYANYPLTNLSSVRDFQYVLFLNEGPGGGPGWNCPLPCNVSSDFASFADKVGAAVGMSKEPPQARDENARTATATFATPFPKLANSSPPLSDAKESPALWPGWTWWAMSLCGILILATVTLACCVCPKVCAKKSTKRARTSRALTAELKGELMSSSEEEVEDELEEAEVEEKPAALPMAQRSSSSAPSALQPVAATSVPLHTYAAPAVASYPGVGSSRASSLSLPVALAHATSIPMAIAPPHSKFLI